MLTRLSDAVSRSVVQRRPSTAVAAWRRSTYSDQGGGSCVEIAGLSGQVGMRDSKAKRGPAILVSDSAFEAFVEGLSA